MTSTQEVPVDSTSLPRPIEVLIYAPVVGRGGVRRLVDRLLPTWLDNTDPQQWRFRVLSQPADESARPIDWPPGTLIPLDGDGFVARSGSNLFDYLNASQDAFFERLRQHAQGVHVVWLPHPWWTLRLKRAVVDIPAHLVPTVHDFAFDHLVWSGTFGDGFRAETRAFVGAASELVFSSRFTLDYAVSHYHMRPEQGKVIYLGDFLPDPFVATPAEAERVRARYKLPNQFWLAFHATGHKDPLTIFEAVAEVKRQQPELHIPLVLAGVNTERMLPGTPTFDSYSDKVKTRLQELGLAYQRDYSVLGFVADSDVGGLYAAATGCITASHSEAGLSATVFESFASRTPLIFSDIPQFIERLGSDATFGLQFHVGDHRDLARAMLTLRQSPEATAARIDAAYHLFHSRSWKDIAHDYLTVFEALAAQGPSKRVWTPPLSVAVPQNAPPDRVPVRRTWGQRMPQRLKDRLFEDILPRLNLTSYGRLQYTRMRMNRIEVERQQLLDSQHHLTQEVNRQRTLLNQIAEIGRRLVDPAEIIRAWETLEHHFRDETDHNLGLLQTVYQDAIHERRAYWDIRKAAYVVSTVLKPRSYLEVGTRMGWSLAEVMRAAPDVRAFVFDLWIPGYASAQGTPEFIRRKMQAVVGSSFVPHIEFISGNSHDTLPAFFERPLTGSGDTRPASFDLVAIDGDHTVTGAWWDIHDTLPHVSVGGASIFDDLDSPGEQDMQYTTTRYQRPPVPDGLNNLGDVWQAVQQGNPNFVFFNCETY